MGSLLLRLLVFLQIQHGVLSAMHAWSHKVIQLSKHLCCCILHVFPTLSFRLCTVFALSLHLYAASAKDRVTLSQPECCISWKMAATLVAMDPE